MIADSVEVRILGARDDLGVKALPYCIRLCYGLEVHTTGFCLSNIDLDWKGECARFVVARGSDEIIAQVTWAPEYYEHRSIFNHAFP